MSEMRPFCRNFIFHYKFHKKIRGMPKFFLNNKINMEIHYLIKNITEFQIQFVKKKSLAEKWSKKNDTVGHNFLVNDFSFY